MIFCATLPGRCRYWDRLATLHAIRVVIKGLVGGGDNRLAAECLRPQARSGEYSEHATMSSDLAFLTSPAHSTTATSPTTVTFSVQFVQTTTLCAY